MKKFFTLIAICAFVSVPAIGEPNKAHSKAAGTPILVNFPKAAPEATYKNVEKIYRFNADSSCDVRTKTALKINTLFAMNELCGETFIVYNPKFQSVKIHEAYTLMADGTRVNLPENAKNEVLPKAAADAPAFNFLRELIITHTALEPGAVIYLDYTLHYKNTERFAFDEFPDMPFPCEHLSFDFNGAVSEFFNVPARSREANFKPQKTIPVIYPGMKRMKSFVINTLPAHLDTDGKRILAHLFETPKTKRERILQIQKFVLEKIANVNLPLELLNFELRTPIEVLKSSYGTPAERAILLKAMLAAIDVPATIEVHDEKYFVREANLGLLPLVEGEAPLGDKATCQVSANVKLDKNQEKWLGNLLFSKTKMPCTNLNERAAALGFSKENFALLSEKINASEEPAQHAQLSFAGTREINTENELLIWTPPQDKQGIAKTGFDKLPSQRRSPFNVGNLSNESYQYRIECGNDYEFVGEKREEKIQNSLGSVSLRIVPAGKTLIYEKCFQLAPIDSVPADKYQEFRTLMQAWFAPHANCLVFKNLNKK